MSANGGDGQRAVTKSELLRIVSPLVLFALHLLYLAWLSPDPFITRWLEGSFTFFLALVLCNVIRARILSGRDRGDDGGEPSDRPSAG